MSTKCLNLLFQKQAPARYFRAMGVAETPRPVSAVRHAIFIATTKKESQAPQGSYSAHTSGRCKPVADAAPGRSLEVVG